MLHIFYKIMYWILCNYDWLQLYLNATSSSWIMKWMVCFNTDNRQHIRNLNNEVHENLCTIIFHLCTCHWYTLLFQYPGHYWTLPPHVSVCVLDDLEGYSSVEERSVYGVENSSMFLECSPKSQRALIYWQLQRPNDERKHEVHTQWIT